MTLKNFLSTKKRLFAAWSLFFSFLYRYLYHWPFSFTTILYLSSSGVSYHIWLYST